MYLTTAVVRRQPQGPMKDLNWRVGNTEWDKAQVQVCETASILQRMRGESAEAHARVVHGLWKVSAGRGEWGESTQKTLRFRTKRET